MRLHGLSNKIIFDEFPPDNEGLYHVFFSSTFNVEYLTVPNDVSMKIYTSEAIAKQMILYFSDKDVNTILTTKDFMLLQSGVTFRVPLTKETSIEGVMFESEAVNRNLTYLLKTKSRVTHMYCGLCTEFRNIMLNATFLRWVQNGVDNLYVDVNLCSNIDHEGNQTYSSEILEDIEAIIDKNRDFVVIVIVPKFGYESLIYALSEHFRSRVSIGGIMNATFQILNKHKYFVPDKRKAKIVIAHKSFTIQEMKRSFLAQKYVFVKIVDKSVTIQRVNSHRFGLYELAWSTFPSAFHLQLLASAVSSRRIHAIHHEIFATQMPPNIPDSLMRLCKDYKIIAQKKLLEEVEHFKMLDQVEFQKSIDIADHMDIEATYAKVLLTQDDNNQDDNNNNNMEIVRRWLDDNDKSSKLRRSESKEEPQNQNSFSIVKGSLRYLHDSDST